MPEPTPRTCIFDLDGTLIDSLPGISSALSIAFRSIGRELPGANLRSLIGPPIRVIAKHLDPTLNDAETAEIERTYRTAYDETAWIESILFPEVDSTLRTLATLGHKLFLLTNKPSLPTTRILRHLDLMGLFTEIVTRDSSSPHFPSKSAMLASLIHSHLLDPNQSIVVGDTAEDQHAAAANQVPFVYMTYGYGQCEPGCASLDNFAGLLAEELLPA